MASWLYLTSASVTNGSVTVSVTGNHDLSFVESGWSFDVGSARAEILSGTAPDNNGNSTLTLVKPWAGANITGQEAQIVPTSGALRAAIVAMNDTNDYAIVTHQTLEEIATLDKDVTIKDPTGEEHTFATMPKNSRLMQEFLGAAGTAAGYDVTESPQDIEIGKLVKVEEKYFTTNFSVTLPESVTRRYMDVELPIISRSLLIKVSAVAKQAQQLGTGGFEAVYIVERSNVLSVNTLYCSEFTGSYRIGLAEPIIEGNIVHFGLRRGNNGTSTNANVHFKVEVLCESRSDFNLIYSDGSVSHAYANHPNKVLHTGNLVGTVSQSSSVPTGAVIERGSNANGEYTKFADGTLICTIAFTTSTSDTVNGDVVVLPISFINTSYRIMTNTYGALSLATVSSRGAGKTTSQFRMLGVVNGAFATAAFDIIVIGRWY